MDSHTFQKSRWNQIQEFFLPPVRISDGGSHASQFKSHDERVYERGHFEIEMLIWISVITLILGGFFHIYKAYKNEHHHISEEFNNEWNKLESQRRTQKKQQQ